MRPKKSKKPVNKAVTESISSPIFDSIKQCSAATGIPQSKLKSAKDAGCLGFRHGRVYLFDVLKWLFLHPAETSDDFIDLEHQQARLAKEKADSLQAKREREEKESNFLEEVEGILNEQLILPCRSWLISAPSSLAPRLNPSNPDAARKVLDETIHKEFFPLMRAKLTKAAKQNKN